jgi:hypothetical protein
MDGDASLMPALQGRKLSTGGTRRLYLRREDVRTGLQTENFADLASNALDTSAARLTTPAVSEGRKRRVVIGL